jgi:hypothetical protein
MRRDASAEEPFVVALLELALDLLHRVEATPTMIRMEVPPNGKFWFAWITAKAMSGIREIRPR